MRKKIITAIAVMMLLTLGSSSFAAMSTTWPTTVSYKQSNNVDLAYYSNQQNYTIVSKHTAGNRIYSTSNNTSNIMYQENDDWKGKDIAGTGVSMTTTTGESVYSGWSSQ